MTNIVTMPESSDSDPPKSGDFGYGSPKSGDFGYGNDFGFERVLAVTESALKSGALAPIETEVEIVPDGGIPFQVRRLHGKSPKPKKKQLDATRNPFLPYDPALFVGDAGTEHVCLLNKYPVVPNHVLIVTRRFVDQTSLLSLADFTALAHCMQHYPSLGFYNSAAVAGASQPHKHLQIVPLPFGPENSGLPWEKVFEEAIYENGIGKSQLLPFPHALGRLAKLNGEELLQTYQRLGRSLAGLQGLATSATDLATSATGSNVLVHPLGMLMVPRSEEKFHGISLNALAFAGALLVKNEKQYAALRKHSPLAALRFVTT